MHPKLPKVPPLKCFQNKSYQKLLSKRKKKYNSMHTQSSTTDSLLETIETHSTVILRLGFFLSLSPLQDEHKYLCKFKYCRDTRHINFYLKKSLGSRPCRRSSEEKTVESVFRSIRIPGGVSSRLELHYPRNDVASGVLGICLYYWLLSEGNFTYVLLLRKWL